MKSPRSARGPNRNLDSVLTEFALFVKKLCPGASVKITKAVYEDEDANIFVRPPVTWTSQEGDSLEGHLAKRSIDILRETGYHILVGVFESATENPDRALPGEHN